MTTPRVSVLVPTFNRAPYLAECLESLLSQTLPAHEVIVVNDGSTDSTQAVLSEFRDRIRTVRTRQRGKPAALNAGMVEAEGEYVWIFDDDDVALPDALERFVTPLEAHPECGFSYSPFFFSENETGGTRIGRVTSTYEAPDLSAGFVPTLLEVNFLGGAALFARKRCYDEVGPFDPRLVRSQDYEMAVRLARRYDAVAVTDGPTFHYRQHDGLRGRGDDRFRAAVRKLKWLEYDQLFFRELRDDLDLVELLPPRTPLEGHRRLAILRRLAVMATKLLAAEAAEDVRALAALGDDRPFEDAELDVVRGRMTEVPYYAPEWILDDPAFREALETEAERSPTVRQLSEEVEGARAGPRGRARRLREGVSDWLARQRGHGRPDVAAESR